MPHHKHPPGPPHGHHHRLRISPAGVARAGDILSRFFDARTAAVLVEQATHAPPEPTALFFAATAHSDTLANLLEAQGVSDLKALGDKIIDPDSEMHSFRIAIEAAASIETAFPKDMAVIAEGLGDGPDEMCAAAIVQALNASLGAALAASAFQPKPGGQL